MRDKARKYQEQAEQRRKQPENESDIKDIIPALYAVIQELYSANDEYAPKNKSDHFWHKAEVYGLWAAAIVGIAAIIIGSHDASEQRAVMAGQLNEMADEQRPWVYSDTPIIQSQITVNAAGWYQVDVKFPLRNTGHLPAKYVYVIPKISVLGDVEGIAEEVKKTCSEGTGPVGITVFPGQEFNYTPTIGIDPLQIYTARKSGASVNYVVFGCVVYQAPRGNTPHASGFAYLLGKRKGQGQRTIADPLPTDITSVAADDLALVPWISQTSFEAY